MTDRVVIWCPAGRRANMELLLPFLRRILDENPETECDIWNLARDSIDGEWLRHIEGERMRVINELYGLPERNAFVGVYSHYARPEYRGAVFVKIDDDIVFIETERFPRFLDTVRQIAAPHDTVIVSADTINNGACATLEPRLAGMFPEMGSIPLEAYQSAQFAQWSHEWFFDNWPDILGCPVTAHWVQDWLSINLVAYTWATGCRLTAGLGTKPPKRIAGRPITSKRMGDEGMANTMPRLVLQGFTAAHLSYGPQHKQLPEPYWQQVREEYGRIGKQYLETP